MARVAIIAPALMGEQLAAMGRPELALFFFLRARADADPVNAAGLDQIIAAARDAVAALPNIAGPAPQACIGDERLAEAQMTACLRAADRAFAHGDTADAEPILSNLLKDVPEGSLRAGRTAAARDLMLLRLLTREPADPDLISSVNRVANHLASINEVPAAAVLAARVARTLSDRGLHDRNTVETCGHVARRAARDGMPDLARRMLALQRAANLAGAPPAASLAGLPEQLLDRHLVDAMLRIEAGHLAAAAGHARLAEAEWAAADRAIAALDLEDWDRIADMTIHRHAKTRVFFFPTYAGALELVGRLALRLPAGGGDARRDKAQIQWMVALEGFRGDTARAGAIADAAIRAIRARPDGRSAALVTLLTNRSRMLQTTNPTQAQHLIREAYGIVARQPGEETRRIALLLDLAGRQTDRRLSRALVAEAQKLREATPDIALDTTVELDMRRAVDAFLDGDAARAVELAEAVVARLDAAGRTYQWSTVGAARRLASLYAAAGRLPDARRTYEAHIFPRLNAAVIGEEGVIFDRIGLANLEAYYAPDRKTADTLAHLLDLARRRAGPGSDLIRSIRRSQAFAFHGLGMGRQARAAAREALNTDRPPATDTTSIEEDRILLEALVGASWQAGHTQASP